jgi:hypothetical protein
VKGKAIPDALLLRNGKVIAPPNKLKALSFSPNQRPPTYRQIVSQFSNNSLDQRDLQQPTDVKSSARLDGAIVGMKKIPLGKDVRAGTNHSPILRRSPHEVAQKSHRQTQPTSGTVHTSQPSASIATASKSSPVGRPTSSASPEGSALPAATSAVSSTNDTGIRFKQTQGYIFNKSACRSRPKKHCFSFFYKRQSSNG